MICTLALGVLARINSTYRGGSDKEKHGSAPPTAAFLPVIKPPYLYIQSFTQFLIVEQSG